MTAIAPTGGRKRRRPPKPLKLDSVRNEINVTPLVDVCLVLLIIFMVVTPMLARGKDVPLPKTLHHDTEHDKAQPVVAVDEGGQVWYAQDEAPVDSLETLKQRIQETWDADSKIPRRVFVKAHVDLPYKEIYPVIIAIHELGVPGIDLGSHERIEKSVE
jgi:biopolymer transport protein TolR